MFNRIIVPVDGSKRAEAVLPYVRLLAGTFNTRVSLLQGTEFDESSLPVEFIGAMSEIKAAEIKEKARQAAEEYLNGIQETMETTEVDQVITPDQPEAAISSESSPDSLITMSTHGRSGLRQMDYGQRHGEGNPKLHQPNAHSPPGHTRQPAREGDLETGRKLLYTPGSPRH